MMRGQGLQIAILHLIQAEFGRKSRFNMAQNFIFQELNEICIAPAISSLVTTLLSVSEVCGSIPWPVKSDKVSPTARHRCDDFSELCY